MFFNKVNLGESLKLMLMSSKERRYFLWKRAALIAKGAGLTTVCSICGEPIFPGEFVATGMLGDKKVTVHAGFHNSLKDSNPVVCETGAIGIGYWNGKGIDGIGESVASRVMRTGKSEVFSHR